MRQNTYLRVGLIPLLAAGLTLSTAAAAAGSSTSQTEPTHDVTVLHTITIRGHGKSALRQLAKRTGDLHGMNSEVVHNAMTRDWPSPFADDSSDVAFTYRAAASDTTSDDQAESDDSSADPYPAQPTIGDRRVYQFVNDRWRYKKTQEYARSPGGETGGWQTMKTNRHLCGDDCSQPIH